MAFYKTSFDIVVKNSRLFSLATQKILHPWFEKLKALPTVIALETTPKLNYEQWTKLRKEVLDCNIGLKTPSLDVTIIQLCSMSKNLDLGKSYLKYLQENKYDLNAALVGKYFLFLYNCRDALTDLDKKEILIMYDNLRRRYPLLDGSTAENCILALSLTERWRETLELLEMIKLSSAASSASYSAIIIAAFGNGDPEIGWKYLSEVANLQKIVYTESYIAIIDYCLKNFKQPDVCVEEISKLFHFMTQYDLMPEETAMEKIKNAFKGLGWVGTFTSLSNVGVCLNCKRQLEPLKLSEEDFSYLSKTVLDKALVGSDVYFKSTPIEVKRFVKFVNKTKPYNVVIDGLNVAYKNRKFTRTTAAQQLASVVRYFMDKNQVILVLGRKHMYSWDQKCMNFIKNNSFLFLTDNLSADDPCLLYATLASGLQTKFVSGDLMRQHKFILRDAALERMFKRWQMGHQCFVTFKKNELSVIQPLSYLPATQGDENCWHIPYKLSTSPLTESYEPPSEWLCLERHKPCSK